MSKSAFLHCLKNIYLLLGWVAIQEELNGYGENKITKLRTKSKKTKRNKKKNN